MKEMTFRVSWGIPLLLCACSAPDPEQAQDGDVITQLVVVEHEDGSLTEHLVKTSRKAFQRELAWKTEATQALEKGLPIPAAPDRSSDVVEELGTVRQALYYGDEVEPCYGNYMWLSSSSTGNYLPSNTICFRKNTIGGVGETNLYQFYNSASNPACPFGDERVAHCTRSWWAGADPGGFRSPSGGGAPSFSAYRQCNGCVIGNWGFMGFL
ncbi:MAG TPA: hypothetical protein VJN18_06910 [Polyangiaceae bacterium]|nr:hypothetical protein [Polyangiaceae bacterium]